MDYRLYIRKRELVNQDGTVTRYPWRELDLGDERPAMTYQANTLAELRDRNASYSQKINLPKSNHNCRELGFIDTFQVVADVVADPPECRLDCDGVTISPRGALLTIDSIGRSIECQIVSATLDLFKQMDVEIGSEFGGEFGTYELSLQAYKAWLANPGTGFGPKYMWGIIKPYAGVISGNPIRGFHGSEVVDMYGLVPSVSFYDTIRYIFRKFGYKLISDIVDADYLTVGNAQVNEDSGGAAVAWYGQVYLPLLTSDYGIVPPSRSDALDMGSTGTGQTMRMVAPNPGSYAVNIRIVCQQPISPDIRRVTWNLVRRLAPNPVEGTYILVDQDIEGITAALDTSGSYIYDYTTEVNLGTGDGLILSMTSRGETTERAIADITVSMMCVDDLVQIGYHGSLLQDLGFKTYAELVKTWLQVYGASLDVVRYSFPQTDGAPDEVGPLLGEVRCYSFSEMERRINAKQFVDWSDKIVISTSNQWSFKTGDYAQRNYINFTVNEPDGLSDRIVLIIQNGSLSLEKDLFTMPIQAGRDLSYAIGAAEIHCASVPVLTSETETMEIEGTEIARVNWFYEGCAPHLVFAPTAKAPIVIRQGNNWGIGPDEDLTDGYYLEHRPSAYLHEQYYSRIEKMLGGRAVKWEFNLDVIDVGQIDFFTPVWIEQFRAFFYISKINNFVAGKPTTVDLIKL